MSTYEKVATVRLEHANLTVKDIDATAQFLRTAFPDFRIRNEGKTLKGNRYVHVGTDDTYFALTESNADPAEDWVPYSGAPGLNHFGFEVDDVEALRQRLSTAGYTESTVPNSHPHRKRVYFYDPNNHDWEFVQYLSDVPSERHDYELPDG